MNEFADVLLYDGDAELVDAAIAEALDAGVSEEEIAAVMKAERRDRAWVPVVSGKLLTRAQEVRREVERARSAGR
jgi:hypothetical protein